MASMVRVGGSSSTMESSWSFSSRVMPADSTAQGRPRRHWAMAMRSTRSVRRQASFNSRSGKLRTTRLPAVNLRMQWESRRQRCLKIDLFSGDGVVEFQILGVQEISSIAGEAGEIFQRPAG